MFTHFARRAGFWLVALPLASLCVALLLMIAVPAIKRNRPAPTPAPRKQRARQRPLPVPDAARRRIPLKPIFLRVGLSLAAAAVALVALIFLFVAVLPLSGRYATYAVLSDSMQPAIPIGSLAIAVPASPAELQVGDVISYTALQPDHPSITHRIVSVQQTDDGLVFRTKGDANATDDAWNVRYTRLAGRVVGAVPLLGYIIVGATQPEVRTGLAAALIVLLGGLWLRAVLRGALRLRLSFPNVRRHTRAMAASLGMIAIWTGSLVGPTGSTYGSFSSTTTNPSNTFTTASQLAPQNVTTTADCTGGDIVIDWSAPTGSWATSYSVYRSTTTGTELSGTLVQSGVTGTSLADTTATNVSSTTYFYKVVAFDSLGNGGATTASTEASSSGCPASVVTTLPAGGSTGVSAAQPNGSAAAITVDFDQSLLTSTVTSTTFTISPSVTVSSYTFNTYNGNSNAEAVMNLGANLAASTTYTVTLTTGVKNANSVALSSNYAFVFSTGTSISTTGPVVLTVSPTNSATGIALNSTVTVNFSTSINTSTVTNGSTFCLYATGGSCSSAVSGTFAWSGSPSNSTLTFTPSAQLDGFVSYKITLSSTIADTTGGTGHTLGSNYSSSFTTVSVQSTTLPTIVNQYPSYNGNIALSTAAMTLTFSTSMDHGAVESSFCLFANTGGSSAGGGTGTCAANAVAGTFSWSGNTVSFQPSASLATGAPYAFTLQGTGCTSSCGTTATDGLGNALDASNTPLSSTSGSKLSGQQSYQYASAFTVANNCTQSAGVTPSTAFPGGNATTVNKNPSWATGDSLKLTWDTSTGATLATGVMGAQCSALQFTVPITATSGSHTLFLKDVTSAATDSSLSITVTTLSASTAVMSMSSQKPGITEPQDAAIVTANVLNSGSAAVNAGVQFTVTSWPSGTWATLSSSSGATDASGNASTTLIITGAPSNAGWVQVSAVVGIGNATGCPSGTCSLKLPAIPGPSVVGSLPTGTSVVENSLVTIQFNESMTADTTSNSAAHFCLSTSTNCSTGIVSGSSATGYTNGIAWGGNPSNTVLTFKPASNLSATTTYYINVGTSEKAFGNINPLASAYSTSFTTGSTTDAAAPTVSSISPGSGQTAIDTGTDVTITFSEAMNEASVETAFCLFLSTSSCSNGGVTGTFSWPSTSQMVFQPTAGLQEPSVQYKVTIATTATDEAGNAISSSTTCVTSACTFTTNSNSTPSALTISASPTQLTPSTVSAVTSTITTTVKTNGSAVSGKTVTFSVTTDPTSGIPASVSPTSGTTNASGQVTTTLTLAAATPAATFDAITITASVTLFSSPNAMTGCPAGSTCTVVINDPPPPPPSGLVATPGSIWLHWVEPDSDRIAGYKVYYGLASDQLDHEIDAGKSSALHIEDVIPGATYYLAARSYGADGKLSAWSEEVSITLPPATATPTPIPCGASAATSTPAATATPCAATSTATATVASTTTTPVASATVHTTSTPAATLTSSVSCQTPTSTPSPTPTGSVTATPTPSLTGSPTPTYTPTPSPTPCPTATSTATETATATSTATATGTPVETGTPEPNQSPTPAQTAATTQTWTPTPTPTTTSTPTSTPTATATSTPTATATPSATKTPTVLPTSTPTLAPTATSTLASTSTPTHAPTNTPVPPTATPTH